MSRASNTPRNQIRTSAIPTRYEGRENAFAWTSEPNKFPAIEYMYREARLAAARGDKQKYDEVWAKIQARHEAKRNT